MQTPTPIPSPESWLDKYGPIGFVAALALAALWFGIHRYLREATERQRSLETMLAAQREAVDQLNTRLVEAAQRNHDETLELLAENRREADDRYNTLLERHLALSDTAREKMLELAHTVTVALQTLSKKAHNGNGNKENGA